MSLLDLLLLSFFTADKDGPLRPLRLEMQRLRAKCVRTSFLLSPLSDAEVVYRNRDGHVIKFNFVSNETEVILSNTTFVSARMLLSLRSRSAPLWLR